MLCQTWIVHHKVLLVNEVNEVRKREDSSASSHQDNFTWRNFIKLKPKPLLLADIQALPFSGNELMRKLPIRIMLKQQRNGLSVAYSFNIVFFQLFATPQMRLKKDDVFPVQKVSTCIQSCDVFIHGKTVKSAQLFYVSIAIEL